MQWRVMSKRENNTESLGYNFASRWVCVKVMYNGLRGTYSRTRTLKWGHLKKRVSIMAVLICRVNQSVRSVFLFGVRIFFGK